MPEPSILDARLAEIDRRLRMIQSGLEPVRDEHDRLAAPEPPQLDPLEPGDREPVQGNPLRAARVPSPPGQADSTDEEVAILTARLSELTTAHERLLATTQKLLIEQADILARATPSVSVTAGPFTDMTALQEFRNALAELPQVHEVRVREYVGSEGAVLDVRLQTPFS
jgi:erythromycin esterase-like protein